MKRFKLLLRRDRGFLGLSVLTMALGLATVITLFSLVNGILLNGLPYPDADRILSLDHTAPGLELDQMGTSRKLYFHYLDNAELIEEIALYDDSAVTLTGEGEAERLASSQVTPSFFRLLGLAPVIGRTFSEEEGREGSPDVAVLSWETWQRLYAGDRNIVGRSLEIDGASREVIGVMPKQFDMPLRETAIWLQRKLDPSTVALGNFSDQALVRYKAEASQQQFETELERLSTGLIEWIPDEQASKVLDEAGFHAVGEPLLEAIVGSVREILWILFGTVGVILLIACANTANLFLVRVEERGQEFGIRSALGADRRRLMGEIFSEGMIIAAIAGVVALFLSAGGLKLIRTFGPEDLPRLQDVGIDLRVVLFALVLSVSAGFVFALLPAFRGTAERVLTSLREATRSGTGSRTRNLTRAGLVVAQVAMGMVLLVGAGLLVRSLLELRDVDPGFDPEGALTVQVSLPETDYPEALARAQFVERALERLRALPGVETVGMATYLPLTGESSGSGMFVEDFPPGEGAPPPVFMLKHISDGYAEAMGLRLIEGRFFEPADMFSKKGAFIVSRSVADGIWPGQSVLGKRLRAGGGSAPEEGQESLWLEIVGVVEDVKHYGLDEEETVDFGYLPMISNDDYDMRRTVNFVLRTAVPPTQLTPSVRSELASLDRNIPLSRVVTLERLIADSRARVSFTVLVLLIASLLALTLAAIGLYGVISYIVSQRTREIGVRLALGAQRQDVVRQVVKGGAIVTLAGIGVGLILALATTRLLESLLFGVSRYDPPTFTTVPILLFVVAMLASAIPAFRASKVEPMAALRQD